MPSLLDSIAELSGVGPKREKALNKLGVFTVSDLLTYYPRRYNDLAQKLPSQTLDGEKVTFKGVVTSPPVISRMGFKKTRLNFRMTIEHDTIQISFFNQPWIGKNIDVGDEVAIYGTYSRTRQSLAAIKMMPKNSEDELEAIYPSSKEIKAGTIKDLILQALGKYKEQLSQEIVPDDLRKRYRLMNYHDTVFGMHVPTDEQVAAAARRTASFMEFFIFQMRLQVIKQKDAQLIMTMIN
jgi:ATP-dependent DNA helicase RecG